MANKDFGEWIQNFKNTIATYEYYVDFDKSVKNAEKYKRAYCTLDSLLGSKNVREEFIEIVNEYPHVINCIPSLIAVRKTEIEVFDKNKLKIFNFDKANYSVEEYANFMDKIGLFNMFSNHAFRSTYDYALGVEVGLDSNGRKNRGGHLMESLVESFIQISGKKYYKEMSTKEIEDKFKLNLSSISNKGNSLKRFDFVIEGKNTIYGVEVNFYTSSGSKLNETARSYKLLAEKTKEIKNFEFIWITDGKGWLSVKNNLKETFESMEHIYNIYELENRVLDSLE